MTLDPPQWSGEEPAATPLVPDVLPDDAPATEKRAEAAAKWFVVSFLIVVPTLGFGLLVAVCYVLWQRLTS